VREERGGASGGPIRTLNLRVRQASCQPRSRSEAPEGAGSETSLVLSSFPSLWSGSRLLRAALRLSEAETRSQKPHARDSEGTFEISASIGRGAILLESTLALPVPAIR
jgi:hypothetical protein